MELQYNLCYKLTHWGRVTHICVDNQTIIGSDNGLTPGRRQAIIRTNTGILLTGHLGTNFSDILIKMQTFSFQKKHLKVSWLLSTKWPPFCLGLNDLRWCLCIIDAETSPKFLTQSRCHRMRNVVSIHKNYRKISNIRHIKSQNLNVPRLALHLSLRNILKPSVKWRMKM